MLINLILLIISQSIYISNYHMYTLNIYNHIYQVFLNKAPTKENLFREDRVQCKYNQNNSSSKCLNMQVASKSGDPWASPQKQGPGIFIYTEV